MTMHISICISTYKRPEGLARLLHGINSLVFEKNPPPTIEVVVADNDADRSAAALCDNLRETLQWPLVYGIEPQKGVSYARNRSVQLASPKADFIVFIDDDEVPDPHCLDELLAGQQTYQADVVAGPVHPYFSDGSAVPSWVLKGGFFEPANHPTGMVLNAAFTNNVLVNAAFLRALDLPFDPRFAIKGSEDTHLFMRLRQQGAKIVWVNEAIVVEHIPPERTTLKWLLERGFWGWSSYSLFERELFPSVKTQLLRLVKGCFLVLAGLLALIPGLFLGRHKLYWAVLTTYRGIGSLSGLVGIQGNW
jgi:succinoglycan biosynthesis protein ExoM